jgi:hypothetical protein
MNFPDPLSRGVATAVYFRHFLILKNAVVWDVAPCRSFVNRRFGGTYRLHLQGRIIRERGTSVSRWLQTTLKMEAIRSSEMSVYTISIRRHFPEDGIFHSHCREKFKSYIFSSGLLANISAEQQVYVALATDQYVSLQR